MANTQTLQGDWNQIKGKIQEKWGNVSGDELDQLKGKTDQIVGLIQKKTGQAREKIEEFVTSISDSGASTVNRTGEKVREYAHAASETVHDYAAGARDSVEQMAGQVKEQAQAGYQQAEQLVRNRPVESLAVCFGVGVITGVVAGLLLRSR